MYIAIIQLHACLTAWLHAAACHAFYMLPCKMVLLFQPSSTAAERVFSLLKNSIQEQQFSALEDYIETSIMLQYNS